jgi:tRNA(fMet)-specific endonuclease VapC
MGLLIDTDVLILGEKVGHLNLARWAHQGQAFVSVVTASELFVGLENANTPARHAKRSAYLEYVFASLPVLGIDLPLARTHARIVGNLPKNITIGTHDTWIAATAIAGGHALLTRNARDFEKFPGLHLEIWTPPAVS